MNCVNYDEDHYAIDEAHGPPALFVFTRVRFAQVQRIFKNERGDLQANLVLCEILSVFPLVPNESHLDDVYTVSHIQYVLLLFC